MCLLIYMPPNTTVEQADLERAAVQNDDGFGWAVIVGSTHREWDIARGHSMNLTTAMRDFYSVRDAYPSMDAMFHLRIATAGTLDETNCHPFNVGDDRRTVLAHNGILPIRGDHRSDTRIFAEEWLPQLGVAEWLDDPHRFAELERFASGSKLLVLSVDPELQRYAYLLNEHDGDWDRGIWFSNTSYTDEYAGWMKDWRSQHQYTLTRSTWDRPLNGYAFTDDELDGLRERGLDSATCPMCETDWAFDLYPPEECDVCGACMECGSPRCANPGRCSDELAPHELDLAHGRDLGYSHGGGWRFDESDDENGEYMRWHESFLDSLKVIDVESEELSTDQQLFATLEREAYGDDLDGFDLEPNLLPVRFSPPLTYSP